jgi:ketosteroid isomerase-like protein
MAKKKIAKKRPTRKVVPAARKKASVAKSAKTSPKASKALLRKRPTTKASGPSRTHPATVVNPFRVLAQRIVDLTVSQDDEGSFALYADRVESVEPGMPPAVGIGAIKQKFTMWRGMVSDSSWQARNVWVDGNTIIIEWTGRVTFAATGKQADLNEVAIHEVENGKIIRERFYYDASALQPSSPR